MSALIDVAERVLARLEAGAEAEVTVSGGQEALTRFAVSFIHQNVADDRRSVSLRVALDGRVASSSINAWDDAALDRLVRNTIEACRLSPVDPGWPGVSEPQEALAVEHWDAGTADADPAQRAGMVSAFMSAAHGLEAAGFCETVSGETAYLATSGQRLSGRATQATLDGICRTADADGSARATSARLADLDGPAVGAEATRRAREASDPTDLDPGRYEVILEPACVVNVLYFLCFHGFNGRAAEEGRSFARLGEGQFDPAISLRDDVTDPMSTGLPFDAEGTPRRRIDLVRSGTTRALCHDRRTAKAAGAASTGHAVPGGATWGAMPANLILEPGERSRDALIAGVQRGLLVTDFWYTRILDPRTQVVTGLTRNGVWLIEEGRVVRPVRNLRFTQSYLEALAPGAVRAVGSELILSPAAMGLGTLAAYAVPALHLASWNFTGGARG